MGGRCWAGSGAAGRGRELAAGRPTQARKERKARSLKLRSGGDEGENSLKLPWSKVYYEFVPNILHRERDSWFFYLRDIRNATYLKAILLKKASLFLVYFG